MEQQSFRTQLVEWMKEIVPYSNFDKYARKTRESINLNIHNTDRDANHVNYVIYTSSHSYSISAKPTYLGCIASTTFHRPGETWTRGNDLPDGPFSRETWEAIKDAIVRYELVKLEPLPDYSKMKDIMPKCAPPTPAENEYNEARGDQFLAAERLARAERALYGLDKREPDMPSDRLLDEPAVEVNEA